MSWLALIPTALQAIGLLKGSSSSRDAANAANAAAQRATVDPAELQRVAQQAAVDNIRNSLLLEQQFTPQNSQLRNQTLNNLLMGSTRDTAGDTAVAKLAELVGKGTGGSLLTDAINQARADLSMGGELPLDVQNAVTRSAIAKAGAVGGGQTGMARALVPRDIGLTSLDLRNQRLSNAANLGQAENQQTAVQANLAQSLQNAGNSQANRLLALFQAGQSLQLPESGLSPGDLASIYMQNATNAATAGMNAAKLQAQTGQNQANMFGSLAGLIKDTDWGSIFGRS